MSKEEIKEKVQEIIDNNYSKFMGTNEAEIHSCFEIAELFDQNTKKLIDEIAELRKTGLEAIKIAEDLSYLKKKYETRVEELQAENTKLKASKSEANEAVESQEDILRELISLIQTSSSVGIVMQQFTITRNNK